MKKKCPYCKKKNILNRLNAKTCGNKKCQHKNAKDVGLKYWHDYYKENKDEWLKNKRDRYHKNKELKNDS